MLTRTALAHCKINLGLAITGNRPDGYHDLRTVMIKLTLADTIRIRWREAETPSEVSPSPGLISLSSDDPNLPIGSGNLAYRAAREYMNALLRGGLSHAMPQSVDIHLEKRIPYGAGLGGGSSDAAATLNIMHSIGRDKAIRAYPSMGPDEIDKALDLPGVALGIGSDVPFFLNGVAGLAEGRGERLTPLQLPQRLHLICAMPHGQLSTRDVFTAYDRVGADGQPDIDTVASALESCRLHLLRSAVYNSLEKAATVLLPEVQEVRRLVDSTRPLCSGMTGSGSCVYGLYGDRLEAERAAAVLSRDSLVRWCKATESLSEEQ